MWMIINAHSFHFYCEHVYCLFKSFQRWSVVKATLEFNADFLTHFWSSKWRSLNERAPSFEFVSVISRRSIALRSVEKWSWRELRLGPLQYRSNTKWHTQYYYQMCHRYTTGAIYIYIMWYWCYTEKHLNKPVPTCVIVSEIQGPVHVGGQVICLASWVEYNSVNFRTQISQNTDATLWGLHNVLLIIKARHRSAKGGWNDVNRAQSRSVQHHSVDFDQALVGFLFFGRMECYTALLETLSTRKMPWIK